MTTNGVRARRLPYGRDAGSGTRASGARICCISTGGRRPHGRRASRDGRPAVVDSVAERGRPYKPARSSAIPHESSGYSCAFRSGGGRLTRMVDASRRLSAVTGGEADQVIRQAAFLDAHPDVAFGWSGLTCLVDWPAPNGQRRRDSFINLEHALDFLEREMGTASPVMPLPAANPDASKDVTGDDAEA